MPHLARNADGDQLLFIHEGQGDLFCDFGHLAYREGDYILLPRGTMWRLEPSADDRAADRGHQRQLQAAGARPARPHAIFDPAVLDTPKIDDAFRAQRDGEWR